MQQILLRSFKGRLQHHFFNTPPLFFILFKKLIQALSESSITSTYIIVTLCYNSDNLVTRLLSNIPNIDIAHACRHLLIICLELEMTKAKKIVIGTLISAVTLGGLITYASPSHHFGRFGGMNEEKVEFIINRISSKLDLDAVQKQNLIALKDTVKTQRELHKQDHPREELMKLLSVPVLDETKVLTMMEARTTQLHLAAPTIVSAVANFTNSLSNEQREEIKNFADKFAKHRGRKFEK